MRTSTDSCSTSQRRQIAVAQIALLCLLTSTIRVSAADRPNILFAFADDWGRYASAYAKLEPGGISDLVSTPNFDRIAHEGVLFRNAFVNAPSCTPCRSSILSGQFFWRTGRGAILQGAVWDFSIPTFPVLLRDAGYHIGYTYKVWGPGTPANAPFTATEAYNRAGSSFNGFSQIASKAEDVAVAKTQLLEQVRGNFRDFLSKRGTNSPFLYWFGPTNCHRKWIAGSGKQLWNINPDDLKGRLPPFLPDVPVVREDVADYLGEVQAFDAALGVLIEELKRIGELDNTLIAVSGDHGMPGVPNGKCNLYDFGVAVPLAIRWPGTATPGRVVDDFVLLPDLTPTFLAAAGLPPAAVMTGRSLVPILNSQKNGQVDPSRDSVIVGRERHVARARTGNLPYPQRAIRTKDYLYIRNFKPDRWPMGTAPGFGQPAASLPSFGELENNTFGAFGDLDASPTKAWIIEHRSDPGIERYFHIAFGRRPEEELYDLRNDPFETQNVADNAEYAAIRQQLSDRLMTTLKETGDPRVTGDGTTFDKPPFASDWQPEPRENQKKR
ncbi:sulfatase-like hydrolase/transferase [bacterium]|nr:sulfatase-like hydrolase/transferase [bacterium]